MLLVLPVPLRQFGTDLLIEKQAHHGIRRWLDEFDSLVVAAPVMPESFVAKHPEISWVPVDDLPSSVQFYPLPWAYRIDQFVFNLFRICSLLGRLVDKSRYLQFAIGSLWGDWAAVGAFVAKIKGRKYSVHTDRVEHLVIKRLCRDAKLFRKIRLVIESLLMRMLHKMVISNAELCLFHGMDTYSAYRVWTRDTVEKPRAFCIHNIHDEGLFEQEKTLPCLTHQFNLNGGTPRIFYAGRFVIDKAPAHWLGVVLKLHSNSIKFHAVWAGDGPLRHEFQTKLATLGLKEVIETPGFVEDRASISAYYRSADLFLFTHITPESPRCLLEALRFGVPIIGYDSNYARDLISAHGSGILVPCGDQNALAEATCSLISSPALLNDLKAKALKDGARFTSKAVFEERSRLIKTYL